MIRLLTLALAIALSALPAAADVSLGCSVRTEHVDAAGVATVIAECRWPLAPSLVTNVLRDPERLASAVSSLAACERLPGGRVLQVHRVGWPFADRQVTLDWEEQELPDGGFDLKYQRARAQAPLASGREAIREDEGRWLVRPDDGAGARVTYVSRYDAGGALKPWLVRRFQALGVARSLGEIRAAIERSPERLAVLARAAEPAQ